MAQRLKLENFKLCFSPFLGSFWAPALGRSWVESLVAKTYKVCTLLFFLLCNQGLVPRLRRNIILKIPSGFIEGLLGITLWVWKATGTWQKHCGALLCLPHRRVYEDWGEAYFTLMEEQHRYCHSFNLEAHGYHHPRAIQR